MQTPLAELLLRRKELNDKVAQLRPIHSEKDMFEMRVRRQSVTDNLDEITAAVPKVKMSDITAEYDHYAAQLRRVDALIQKTNWETQVDTGDIDPYAPFVIKEEPEQ